MGDDFFTFEIKFTFVVQRMSLTLCAWLISFSTYMCICNDFVGARAVKKKKNKNKMDQVVRKEIKIINKYYNK